jgi:hypothetical protein
MLQPDPDDCIRKNFILTNKKISDTFFDNMIENANIFAMSNEVMLIMGNKLIQHILALAVS